MDEDVRSSVEETLSGLAGCGGRADLLSMAL